MALKRIEFAPLEVFRAWRDLPHPAFLDSARFHPVHGRWSLIGADPILVCSVGSDGDENPWDKIRELCRRFCGPLDEKNGLPFGGGAIVGFLGYRMGRHLEKLPGPRPELLKTPELWLGVYDALACFDHVEKKGVLVSSGVDANGVRDEKRAAGRLQMMEERLKRGAREDAPGEAGVRGFAPLWDEAAHAGAVGRILDWIRRGDVYQVNLTYPFFGETFGAVPDLYERLRRENPAPFGAYVDFGEGQILSSSPERFLRVAGGRAQARPIKGTCPRTGDGRLDAAARAGLMASEKDAAELLMITDLLRNDLGRVARHGKVWTPRLMDCEEYETVFHLVSTVEAELRPGTSAVDVLAACFPGGSVTGAPKIRAMEIIHELEPWDRGVYTGALGYFGFDETSDFNIPIRTLVCRDGKAAFFVGGGIVADSKPDTEWRETLCKARGLLRLEKKG
ncbi:MAG: aminodeoxychorismate synthase component I [Verrucomicrobiae bacterium]|nr:aminodeoxychorismate synthase component I [Verrucomicrobiae bacterium]